MKSPLRMGVALGSNQGDRVKYLRTALSWLKTVSLNSVKYSRVYETAPVGCVSGTSSFLNAACEIECDLEPLELLRRMRDFERQCGRPEAYLKNAPRSLDMDLLYAGNLVLQTGELTLPHPQMLARRFVLQPLHDIRPDLVLPGRVQNVSQILAGLKNDHDVHLYHENLQ